MFVPEKELQTRTPEADLRNRPHDLGDCWGKDDGKTLEMHLLPIYSLEPRVTLWSLKSVLAQLGVVNSQICEHENSPFSL